MAGIDPTTVRLSHGFLLSDFMGCDSVYRHGFANPITTGDAAKIEEGKLLAISLDALVNDIGHLSVTYGFISPRLSRLIVKYQNPNKPSYHMWNYGAAADVCPHAWYEMQDAAPISWVKRILQKDLFPASRIITYSESEIVCVGIRSGEVPANKVYENRYIAGQHKPDYIRYPTNDNTRRGIMLNSAAAYCNANDWRGQGHPRYHGGGRFQYEHRRLTAQTLLSDFLYSPLKVHKGIPNRPPEYGCDDDFWGNARQAAIYNDSIVRDYPWRHSIVFAFDCNDRPWQDRYILDYVPSPLARERMGSDSGLLRHFEEATHGFSSVDDIRWVKMRKGENRIRVTGARW